MPARACHRGASGLSADQYSANLLDARAAERQNTAAPRLSAAAAYIRRDTVEFAQYGLLVAGWTVAFLLGKELQGGFAQWRDRRR